MAPTTLVTAPPVARAAGVPTPAPSAEAGGATAAPPASSRRSTRTPTAPGAGAPAAPKVGRTPTIPTQRVQPAAELVPPAPRRRKVPIAVAGAVAFALVATGSATWGIQRDRAQAAEEARQAHARVDEVVAAQGADAAATQTVGEHATLVVYDAGRAQVQSAAQAALAHAATTLAGTPNAGDGPRAALQGASDALTKAAADPHVSFTSLRTATAGIAAPDAAAVQAQAAWQAAENARIAAEQAAAAQAAAAAAAKAKPRTTTSKPRTSTSTSSGGGSVAPAPETSGGVGSVYSAGSIGAALNSFRASQGLSSLAIVSSGARVSHAQAMAASNSIYHSGATPEIVGRVSAPSSSAMINAYANSAGHRAIMVGNYSTAYIGAVTAPCTMGGVSYGECLYTAITFG
ncbi:hypothetical protein [Cellulomonas sp.]|uniref:hypothetical protein n=1 Tax=Cellulomonas sp. TaxID=40001 RepID=UPI001B0A261C|nr:hypothetical protein [Cellulomonas sp.]MBO9553145.1 hypothetical protein [Cellulomonas sp.]